MAFLFTTKNHAVMPSAYQTIIKTMKETKICVIGLGYVGLPLARLFSTKYKTVGFDMNARRCEALMAGHDATLEVADDILQDAINNHGFVCTADMEQIRDCNFYVVAVPTPVDGDNRPDLTPLYGASETVGKVISKGDVVVYESTVYPGVTEDECIPVVEKVSGLKFNEDFFAGYSPERINPGDKLHTVEHIKKVTSGSTPEIGQYVNEVYSSVITAGTHLAPTMKVAEAAKVIENSQRDINIAFVNELSKIFNLMGIDTQAVLEAAGTKWNFLPFRPGLVGGHCIGVDPYYLAQCAQRYGYNPEIILAGRRMNDGMGEYVAQQVIKLMLKKGIQVLDSHILLLGFTFKENCPDVGMFSLRHFWNQLLHHHIEHCACRKAQKIRQRRNHKPRRKKRQHRSDRFEHAGKNAAEKRLAFLLPLRLERHGDDRALGEILNGNAEGQGKRACRRDL